MSATEDEKTPTNFYGETTNGNAPYPILDLEQASGAIARLTHSNEHRKREIDTLTGDIGAIHRGETEWQVHVTACLRTITDQLARQSVALRVLASIRVIRPTITFIAIAALTGALVALIAVYAR